MDLKLQRELGVIFDDTFEFAGVPWEKTEGTATVARSVADGEWSSGGGGLKVTTSTVASEVSSLHRYHSRQPDARRVAFGGRFAVLDENAASVEFSLGYYDGVNLKRVRIRHTFATNAWAYDAGGADSESFQTLFTRDLSETASVAMWRDFAIVAALDTSKIAGVRIDERDESGTVGGVALRSTADATNPGLLDFAVVLKNLGGTPSASVFLLDELYALQGA